MIFASRHTATPDHVLPGRITPVPDPGAFIWGKPSYFPTRPSQRKVHPIIRPAVTMQTMDTVSGRLAGCRVDDVAGERLEQLTALARQGAQVIERVGHVE